MREELADMIAEIKQLNPKPGLKFGIGADPARAARRDGAPGARRQLARRAQQRHAAARAGQPQLLHDGHPRRRATSRTSGYLLECLQNANWLVKSLDQRARTILRVAEEIVRQQDGFLTYGIEHLKPLNLKTVADAISMHELTVSRVTSNKYMATPRGIFELKYFFTSAIASADGEAKRIPPKPCGTASGS